jgi:hypothetical protein
MSEKIDPVISIEIGGKERHLRYDFRAMVAFTKQTGKNLLNPEIVKKIIYDTTPEDLSVMLWAELLHEEPGLELDEVIGWIDMENQALVARKTIEAWLAAMPKGGEEENAPLAKKSRNG